MSNYLILFCLLLNLSAMAQNGKASTIKNTFNRTTEVSIEINATPAVIWGLISDAAKHTRWNSTVISIDGTIKAGEKIKLKSTLDPSRTFKLKVKELNAPNKMVFGDAMGNRIYSIEGKGNGQSVFSMHEKIGGLMFPLFANKIPPFDESFEQIARDLKKEAEKS